MNASRHHGGGGLLDTLAHAALWSGMFRLLRHAPVLVVVAVMAAAGVYMIVRRRRQGR